MAVPAGSLFGDPPDVLDGADGEESQDDLLAQLGDSPAALHEYFMQGRNITGLLRFPSISSAASQPPPQWRETHVLRADARIDRGSLRFAPAAVAATTTPSVVAVEARITTVARVAVVGAVLVQDVQLARKVAIGSVAEAGHTTKFSAELVAVSVSDTVVLEPGPSQPVRLNCTVDLTRVSAADLAPRPDPAESYWPIVVLIQTLETPPTKRGTTEPGPAASKSGAAARSRPETAPGAIAVDVLPAAGDGGKAETSPPADGPALPPATAKFSIVARGDGKVLESEEAADGEEEDAITATRSDAAYAGTGPPPESASAGPVSLWGVAVPAMTQCVLTYCSVDADATHSATPQEGTSSDSVGVASVVPEVAGEGDSDTRCLPAIRVVQEKIQVPQGVYVVREVFGGQPEDEGDEIGAGETAKAPGKESAEASAPAEAKAEAEAEAETEAAECVVCLSAPRDTVLLPCRHLCVCSGCAQALRRQTNKCPVCRGIVSLMLRFDPASSPLDVPITTTLARSGVTEHSHEADHIL